MRQQKQVQWGTVPRLVKSTTKYKDAYLEELNQNCQETNEPVLIMSRHINNVVYDRSSSKEGELAGHYIILTKPI